MGLFELAGFLVGLGVTIALGAKHVKQLVDTAAAPIELTPPSPRVAKEWANFISRPTAGALVGSIERPIFFFALWVSGGWLVLTTWLAFKLAVYWQNSNFAALPKEPPESQDVKWIDSKWRLGSHQTAKLLVGTGAGILCAMAGVLVGKVLQSLLAWQFPPPP